MDKLVTQVSHDQDPAKAAELARLQAAELAKKRKSLLLLKQKIKKLSNRIVVGDSFVAVFENRNPLRSLLDNNNLLFRILNPNQPQLLPPMIHHHLLSILVNKLDKIKIKNF